MLWKERKKINMESNEILKKIKEAMDADSPSGCNNDLLLQKIIDIIINNPTIEMVGDILDSELDMLNDVAMLSEPSKMTKNDYINEVIKYYKKKRKH